MGATFRSYQAALTPSNPKPYTNMGLKDLMKKAGLVEDTGENAATTDTPVAVPSPTVRRGLTLRPGATVPAFGAPVNVPGFGASSVVAPDPDIINTLNEAAAQSKVPGYEQFTVNLEQLKGLPDVQRYAMALNLTNANHRIAPVAVLASLDDRLKLLETEADSFSDAMDTTVTNEVVARQKGAAALDAEIAKLAETIQKKADERDKLVQEAAESEASVAAQRATFDASLNVVRTALASEREKIAGIISTTTAK